MSNILHIKDAYFELPEKCKDDIGCMVRKRNERNLIT